MSYAAPLRDMLAALRAAEAEEPFEALDHELVAAVLGEAGRFAADRIAPLNRVGDQHGSRLENGVVTTPPGWRETYQGWIAGGWNGLSHPEVHGGQGLPMLVNAACIEMWNGASMAFGLGPLLTMGAAEALNAHGSDELKRVYLPKLVSGEWMGTMNLTEPQSGSDLSTLRSRAEPAGDGTYRITGQKIYITYGDHDLTDNIVHLVLARLPGAPPGTKGISLFLVPKVLVGADGRLGPRNDVRTAGLEHKLGIHASPTCTMAFGDNGGAVGYLVGEENRGLTHMFTMMNNARLAVALQGVAIAERATQQAATYAAERRQGRAPGAAGESAIIAHPDVKRMLAEMRAKTGAARAICYRLSAAIDRAHRGADEAGRAAANARASLLTPVAKAFATDIGTEVASLGVQVHGGMGYVEETGAAQHYRDARIAQIYEGTNGIQAIDLVTRKLPIEGGAVVRAEIARLRAIVARLAGAGGLAHGHTAARLDFAIAALEEATTFLLAAVKVAPADALAGATPYLRLFALAAGGAYLADEAMREGDPALVARSRFFAENVAVAAPGLAASVVEGSGSVLALELAS
jgi:alkylation response protein AidB-like acyl-CoA dehydrogenase